MGKPLSECTIEELHSKAKTFKTLLTLICVLMVVMAATVIYMLLNGKQFNTAMIAAFVAILGGAVPSMSGLTNVKKEIASRTSD